MISLTLFCAFNIYTNITDDWRCCRLYLYTYEQIEVRTCVYAENTVD